YRYERRNDTILHEMAHMWFGNLVTMRWWDDLWLNESFATFAAVLAQVEATEYTDAWTTFANVEKSWAYRQDQLPSTHPVAADMTDLETVEANFDGITYAKGASVLKQLVAYVGRESFLSAVRAYFAEHAFGNAEFDDLLSELEKASGRDLSGWAGQGDHPRLRGGHPRGGRRLDDRCADPRPGPRSPGRGRAPDAPDGGRSLQP